MSYENFAILFIILSTVILVLFCAVFQNLCHSQASLFVNCGVSLVIRRKKERRDLSGQLHVQ